MADEPKRGSGVLGRLVLWVVIAALLATVWVLASERNERHFRVTTQSGQLVIERGRYFPTGTRLATEKIYAPVAPPAGEKPQAEMEFDDQNALDQYLFGVLGGWAREATKKGNTRTAAALVERLLALPGLTGAQFAELNALKAELAWDDAHGEVQQAVKLLDEAVRNLKTVAAGKGVHALEAGREADKLQPLADQLRASAPQPGPASSQPAAAPAPPAK